MSMLSINNNGALKEANKRASIIKLEFNIVSWLDLETPPFTLIDLHTTYTSSILVWHWR